MVKFCPKCGTQNFENGIFCSSCGYRFESKITQTPQPQQTHNNQLQQNPSEQYQQYNQYYPPVQSKPRNMKPILAIIAVAIAAIVITASVFLVFTGNNSNSNTSNVQKIPVSGGPRVNMQSLASGSTQTVPEEGCTATYYCYYNGNKIGEITESCTGEMTYNGKNCLKGIGAGELQLEIMGSSVSTTYEYIVYYEKDTLAMVYMTSTYSYTEPYPITMTVTTDYDESSSQIITTTTYLGQTSSSVTTVPSNYWELDDELVNNLYVGYSTEVSYTVDVDGYESDVTMAISITGIEDVTVPQGTFEGCYVIEIDAGSSLISIKIWMNENGIVPKLTTSMLSLSDITLELHEYYTTS